MKPICLSLTCLLSGLSMSATAAEPFASIEPTPSSAESPLLGLALAGNYFNPDVSLILDGQYYQTNRNEFSPTGQISAADHHEDEAAHEHAHEHEHAASNGFNLGESELVIGATIDQFLEGQLVASFNDAGVAVEEAFIKTRALPYGLQLKAGRMLSAIGYRNNQHHHVWDVNDASLPTLAFFGDHGLLDNGVQLTWLPSLPVYTLFGVEAFRGQEQEVFGAGGEALGDTHITTAFIRSAPNLPSNHALQLGIWTAHAAKTQQQINAEHEDHAHSFALTGSQWVYGLNTVYKWDSPKPLGQGDIKFVVELMQSQNDFDGAQQIFDDGTTALAQTHRIQRLGYSAELIYGIAPRWQIASRIDGITATSYTFDDEFRLETSHAKRIDLALNFFPSEFSRLRLQLSHGRNGAVTDRDAVDATSISLGYNVSLGKHPAHPF